MALGLLCGQALICSFFATWPDTSQAFASQFDPMGVVKEAVEDRVGVGGVVDDLMPAVHWKLGCYDGRAAAVSLFKDFEKVVTSASVECLKPPIVKDQDVDASEGAKDAQMAPVAAGQRKIGEHLWDALIENRAVIPASLVAERGS